MKTNLFYSKHIRVFLLAVILALGLFIRITKFDQEGGDHRIYKKAVTEFLSGVNPYKYTIESYNSRTLKKGYAYLPTLLYVYTLLSKVNQAFDLDVPMRQMWKIPTLLADIGIVMLIIKILYKKSHSATLLIILFWLLNPHIVIRKEYVLSDPLSIFFLLWSMYHLGKKDGLSGLMYGIAISLKTYPLILFPLFILNSKNKIKFILSGMLFALIISTPFAKSYDDLITYIQGSILVHSSRGVQGRPILTYLSFYLRGLGINFLQSVYHNIYSSLSLLLPWTASIYMFLKNRNESIYKQSLLPVATYFLLTPVLNRTHLLWFLPVALMGLYETFSSKKVYFYSTTVAIYIIMTLYLSQWNKGIHIYECHMVSIIPTKKAVITVCNELEKFGFSHCPERYGKCLPHCCIQ